jgi:DNA-binding response OmpR family regulator
MVCTDISEAELVSRQLSELNSGCLVTYRRAEDLIRNAPMGRVALIILATSDAPAAIGRTLKWLRRRWPRCPITVVGDQGSGELEMTARKGAACYLTRPVTPEQWTAVLTHVLGQPQRGEVDTQRL